MHEGQRPRTLDAGGKRPVAWRTYATVVPCHGGRPLSGTIARRNRTRPSILRGTSSPTARADRQRAPHSRRRNLLALLQHVGAAVSGTARTPSKWTRAARNRRRSIRPEQGNPCLDSARRSDAGTLRPRHAAPPGGDRHRRRRVDTHFLALERSAPSRRRRRLQAGRQAQRRRHLSRRAQRHRDRERPDGRASGTTGVTQTPRRSRTSRTWPGFSSPWARHRTASRNTPRSRADRRLRERDIPSAPITSRSAVHRTRRRDGGAITIDGRPGRRPAVDFARVRAPRRAAAARRREAHRRRDQSAASVPIWGPRAKLEDGPWPAFPGGLMSIAIVVATQCEGCCSYSRSCSSRGSSCGQADRHGRTLVLCDPHGP